MTRMAKGIRARLVLELLAKGMAGRETRPARHISQRGTVLASEEFSHIQSGDNRQSRSADSGQCAGSRLPNLCSGYTPLGCIPLTFVACGTASTE